MQIYSKWACEIIKTRIQCTKQVSTYNIDQLFGQFGEIFECLFSNQKVVGSILQSLRKIMVGSSEPETRIIYQF